MAESSNGSPVQTAGYVEDMHGVMRQVVPPYQGSSDLPGHYIVPATTVGGPDTSGKQAGGFNPHQDLTQHVCFGEDLDHPKVWNPSVKKEEEPTNRDKGEPAVSYRATSPPATAPTLSTVTPPLVLTPPPEVVVQFHLPGLGSIPVKFHEVVFNEAKRLLALIIDTRAPHFLPEFAETEPDQSILLSLPGSQEPLACEYFGWTYETEQSRKHILMAVRSQDA